MKNNVILERDFEVYKIPLPMKFMGKKKRESFLNGELEKLHPRFSAKDFYDAKISLEKGKLVANVAVMNKMTFARYKDKAGGKLLLLTGNGIKQRPIFTVKEKKMKKIGLVMAALIFGGAILTFGFLQKKGGLYANRNANLEKDFLDEEGLENEMAVKTQLSDSISNCQKVFKSVLENGGLVTNFRASKNNASFKLKNCYPEKIFGSENCVVSYQNGTPNFEVVFSSAGIFPDFSECKAENELGFMRKLRGKILENGGAIESEMQGKKNAMVSFSIDCRNLKKALNDIRFLEAENAWCEKEVDVAVSDACEKQIARVNLEFLPFSSEESFCSLLADFNDVFIDKSKEQTQLKLEKSTQVIRSVADISSAQKRTGKKIGLIRNNDGKIFYYYRGNDGKIRKEVE